MIDENFEYFLEKMGPAMDKRHVPSSSIDCYRGKLPDQLLSYWNEHGWCGYADGLFWTVDPDEYKPVVEAWIGETSLMERDTYHIVARSAFGKLYFWGETTGDSLRLLAPCSFCVPGNSILIGEKMNFGTQVFFGGISRNSNDFDDMFHPALARLGQLNYDEMYGYVPALALGGSDAVASLQKVKAVPHLVFLAQLEPLRVITSPPF